MYSTRGAALMLCALWHPNYEKDISEEIEYIVFAVDSVRLDHPGLHVMGLADWKASVHYWFGASIIILDRKSFVAMAKEMHEEPPTVFLDMYQRRMGENWAMLGHSRQGYFVHPERAAPHARVSTTLTSDSRRRMEYGGSILPDANDPYGLALLQKTGPAHIARWMEKLCKEGSPGRRWIRSTSVPPNLMPDVATERS